MTKWLPIVAALILMAVGGVANGLWNDRWRISHELEDMTARLPHVPMIMGDWEGRDSSDKEFTARLKRQGTLHELVSRVYTNQRTGEEISLLMATGRPGPISTHNPLTCIGGARGAEQITQVNSQPVPGQTAVFSHCDFLDRQVTDSKQTTVHWSWRDRAKGWVVSADPRIAFASYRALTKIYVSCQTGEFGLGAAPRGNDDPATRFLKDCLPTIDAVLFGSPARETSKPTPAAGRSA